MGKINYKEYLKSDTWKIKRLNLLSSDYVKCDCCSAEKWQYKVWECVKCGSKFYGDKWDYIPYCDNCESNNNFIAITNGNEYFQLHHITYKNLGNEEKSELMILCVECHRLVHNLIRLYPFFKKDNVVDYIKIEKNYSLRQKQINKGD